MNRYMAARPVVAGVCIGLLLAGIQKASAQIEEIVVTAEKRPEDVQSVPISISTFSGDFMQESGVDTLQQLGQYTPNLTLSQSSQVANNRIIMRGVGSVGNAAIEPSVGVFIDGVYYPRPSSVVGTLTDLQMVEVLRGPQGTLFGRNASMGALNIHTNNPTREFEAGIRGSVGNYHAYRFSGFVSGPMSDTLSGRLSFEHTDRGGYGRDRFLVTGSSNDVGAWNDVTVRGKLDYKPTESLDVLLTADYARNKNEGPVVEVKSDTVVSSLNPFLDYRFILSTLLNPSPDASFAATGPLPLGPLPEMTNGRDYIINQDHRDSADDEQGGISIDINWQVGSHTVRSITAWRKWKNHTFESALRLPADLLNRITRYEADTVSQELQLLSPTGRFLEYVAGLYYYREDYSIDQNFDLGANFCSPAVRNAESLIALGLGVPAPFAIGAGLAGEAQCLAAAQTGAVDGLFKQHLNSYATFGQATFNITDELHLTGGLRWTRDEKKGSFVQIINNSILAPASALNPLGLGLRADESYPNLRFNDEQVTWLVNLHYDITDDLMAFGAYSTGFKSGGFNSEGTNRTLTLLERTFDSETTDDYEFGVKSAWFDNRLIANLTYFHTKISNFQDRQFDGVNFIVQNAGNLTQQGVEVDVRAQPVQQLYAMFGISYLDSKFDRFPNATNLPAVVAAAQAASRAAGTYIAPPPLNLKGQRNHFSPKWQFSMLGEWTDPIPTTTLSWFVRGEYQYIGDQNVGAETNGNPQSIQKAYDLVNARTGVRGADSKWELSAFVRNAFDTTYCQTIFNQPIGTTLGLVDPMTLGGLQRCVLGAPRTWGLEAAYKF